MNGLEFTIECVDCDDESQETIDSIMDESSPDIFSRRRKLQDTLGEGLMMEFDKLLAGAPLCCPHRDEYDPNEKCEPLFSLPTDLPAPAPSAPKPSAPKPSAPKPSAPKPSAPVAATDPPSPASQSGGDESFTKSRSIIVASVAGFALLYIVF